MFFLISGILFRNRHIFTDFISLSAAWVDKTNNRVYIHNSVSKHCYESGENYGKTN